MTSEKPILQDLLEHKRFVERLAASLGKDSHASEDLVQEAWLAGLRNPPRHRGDLRAWLRTVLRRHAQRDLDHATREGEVDLDRLPGRTVDPESALEENIDRMAVARGVLALRDPYREVILLRYYEDLGPQEIAERVGRSIHTVNSQLRRGLALLRRRLERRGARFPVFRTGRSRTQPPRWLQAQPAAAWLALTALSIAVVVNRWSEPAHVPGVQPPTLEHVDGPAAAPRVGPRATVEPGSALDGAVATQRSPATRSSEDAGPSGTSSAAFVGVRGRVVDVAGAPLAGHPVRFETGAMQGFEDAADFVPGLDPDTPPGSTSMEASAISDDEGYFSLSLSPGSTGRITTTADEHVVLWEPWVRTAGAAADHLELELVVAVRAPLTGRVHGAVDGAIVRVLPPQERAEELRTRSGGRVVEPFDRVGPGGEFSIDDAYALEGRRVIVQRGSSVLHERALPVGSEGPLTVTLSPPTALSGTVRDAEAAGVANALVCAGRLWTRTDSSGRFAFAEELDHEVDALDVLTTTHLPTRVPLTPADRAAGELDVRVERGPAVLELRLVDARGDPLAGFEVWVADPTPAALAFPGLFVEHLLAGPTIRFPATQRADNEGRVTFGGLDWRDYTLRGWNQETGAFFERTALRPTVRHAAHEREATEVRVALDDAASPVRGRVLDARGRPVEGADVGAGVVAFQAVQLDGSVFVCPLDGPRTETGVDGRFEIPRLPTGSAVDTYVRVSAPTFFDYRAVLTDRERALDVVLGREVELALTVADTVAGEGLRFWNAAGELVRSYALETRNDEHRRAFGFVELADGLVPVLVVPDTVAEIEFVVDRSSSAPEASWRVPVDLAGATGRVQLELRPR